MHLQKGYLGHKRFAFDSLYSEGPYQPNGCGTAGCALGEMPAVWPDRFCWVMSAADDPLAICLGVGLVGTTKTIGWKEAAIDWFKIDQTTYYYLFSPAGAGLPVSADRQQVATHIQNFILAQS